MYLGSHSCSLFLEIVSRLSISWFCFLLLWLHFHAGLLLPYCFSECWKPKCNESTFSETSHIPSLQRKSQQPITVPWRLKDLNWTCMIWNSHIDLLAWCKFQFMFPPNLGLEAESLKWNVFSEFCCNNLKVCEENYLKDWHSSRIQMTLRDFAFDEKNSSSNAKREGGPYEQLENTAGYKAVKLLKKQSNTWCIKELLLITIVNARQIIDSAQWRCTILVWES